MRKITKLAINGSGNVDERSRLLSAQGGRRALSARNVVTLTRLARMMKGGGEGGPKGYTADQLPNVTDVLAALDATTKKNTNTALSSEDSLYDDTTESSEHSRSRSRVAASAARRSS